MIDNEWLFSRANMSLYVTDIFSYFDEEWAFWLQILITFSVGLHYMRRKCNNIVDYSVLSYAAAALSVPLKYN